MQIEPIGQTDFYKTGHQPMYPAGTGKIYSNLTPRKSRIPGINAVVVTTFQYLIKEYLIEQWNREFFNKPVEQVVGSYKRMMDHTLGMGVVSMKHIEDLHALGYMPLKIKALPEGSLCPIGVPCMTITNTVAHAFWLVNYLETIISCTVWQGITSATIAYEYRKLLTKYAKETTGTDEFVQWQGHDFSMRGMSSLETACISGAGHLLSFTGTDTVPAIIFLEKYYGADVEKELVGASVPATEHSVMCMGLKGSEIETFERLLNGNPTGILSVVSDTWDLWKVLTEYLPQLKEKILARDGKLVIRPDSGNPVDILCGIKIETVEADSYEDFVRSAQDVLDEWIREETPHGEHGGDMDAYFRWNGKVYHVEYSPDWNRYDKQYYYIDNHGDNTKATEVELTPVQKGVVELLWDTFGGTVNDKGYKVLDSHIGAIYGDSITLVRAGEICERLKVKGFASTNVVLGIGSYTYQFNTRDTFGFAVKATYGEVNGEGREIFKDPITDDGTKKSAKGLLQVLWDKEQKKYILNDQVNADEEEVSALETIFLDGQLVKFQTLSEIRATLKSFDDENV